MRKQKPYKYKIVMKTEPSKHNYTQEEIDQKIDKALNIMVDDLKLNGKLNPKDSMRKKQGEE